MSTARTAPADLLIRAARIHTLVDGQEPQRALAVRADRVAALSTSLDGLDALIGPDTGGVGAAAWAAAGWQAARQWKATTGHRTTGMVSQVNAAPRGGSSSVVRFIDDSGTPAGSKRTSAAPSDRQSGSDIPPGNRSTPARSAASPPGDSRSRPRW